MHTTNNSNEGGHEQPQALNLYFEPPLCVCAHTRVLPATVNALKISSSCVCVILIFGVAKIEMPLESCCASPSPLFPSPSPS